MKKCLGAKNENTLKEVSIEDLIRKKVRITTEELRELDKENDIKLLRLLEYLRERSNKKIQKETN